MLHNLGACYVTENSGTCEPIVEKWKSERIRVAKNIYAAAICLCATLLTRGWQGHKPQTRKLVEANDSGGNRHNFAAYDALLAPRKLEKSHVRSDGTAP